MREQERSKARARRASTFGYCTSPGTPPAAREVMTRDRPDTDHDGALMMWAAAPDLSCAYVSPA